MKSRLTYFLIYCLLRLNGWRPVFNSQGQPSWHRKIGKVDYIGGWDYAVLQMGRMRK